MTGLSRTRRSILGAVCDRALFAGNSAFLALLRKTRGHRPRLQSGQAGLTLIELLVVMVIVALFATIVGTRVGRNVDKARQVAAKSQISEYESALDQFKLDVGRYPSNEEGLEALRTRPANSANWDGPYLRKDVPADPWGRSYVYRFPGTHGDFDLLSLGADGHEGGDGDNTDIVNW